MWFGVGAAALVLLVGTVSYRGRRLFGWVATLVRWLWRGRRPLDSPSRPAVGTMLKPGIDVAVRWQGDVLVAAIEIVPRPFSPTIIIDGKARSDDVIDTELLTDLLAAHCPDLEADVISTGYRLGGSAPEYVTTVYGRAVGSDPAPARRRTWIVLRADPSRTVTSAALRGEGIAGLGQYLVSSTTRIADRLAGIGIDAVCVRKFDELDRATEISFKREGWSKIHGDKQSTVAYRARGGPDVWWSARAERTITRVRLAASRMPSAVVLLTYRGKAKRPRGFSRVSGAQRAAITGSWLAPERHHRLPIGSAGVLIGLTARGHRIYMPLDDVDVSFDLGTEPEALMSFTSRAAAAGGIVTLEPQYERLAELIGANLGPKAKVSWPGVTTYLDPHPGAEQVRLQPNEISTPRHPNLQIQPIAQEEDSQYRAALPSPVDDFPIAGASSGPQFASGSGLPIEHVEEEVARR
jgi:type VII secretion protein EccE